MDKNNKQDKNEFIRPDYKKNRIKPFSMQIDVQDIRLATDEERKQLFVLRESMTYWKDAMRRFRKNKTSMIALCVLIAIALFAFVGPMISPYSYDQQIRGSERLFPTIQHIFGTDSLGRDMLVRVMIGTRISLSVGIVASVIVLMIGIVYGSVAGYVGGMVDNVMMRFVEIIGSIPDVLIVILLSITLKAPFDKLFATGALKIFQGVGSSLISIFIAFALLYWVNMARMIRGQILILKQMEYVTAAKALGASGKRIVFKHLIPNSIGTIIVTSMFQIPSAIFTESFLSFLGLGVSIPMASLGSLASGALEGMRSYPYLMIFPALFISLIILSFNLIGDGLRDALDPRMRI